ncbi:MAG: ribonuclease PH [Sulfobacillus sp.]|nr:ribonuclease PH [Sulfobacillus sp.]
MVRADGRDALDIRPLRLELGFNAWAEGSCLITVGRTQVLVTATVEEKVPPFMRGTGQGWIQAEYAMLPRATQERTHREAVRGRQQGRSVEIQRLIGRALRGALDLSRLGERSVILDCDVLQADGGTRTAAITAGFMALWQALLSIHRKSPFHAPPLKGRLAAVSVGLQNGQPLVDLTYAEDSVIGADFNLVRLSTGDWVEIQGTAEHRLFSRTELDALLDAAEIGLSAIDMIQAETFPEGAVLIES